MLLKFRIVVQTAKLFHVWSITAQDNIGVILLYYSLGIWSILTVEHKNPYSEYRGSPCIWFPVFGRHNPIFRIQAAPCFRKNPVTSCDSVLSCCSSIDGFYIWISLQEIFPLMPVANLLRHLAEAGWIVDQAVDKCMSTDADDIANAALVVDEQENVHNRLDQRWVTVP